MINLSQENMSNFGILLNNPNYINYVKIIVQILI